MQLFLAVFSILTLQIGLCLFGYYQKEKLKSAQSFNLEDHSEYMSSLH